MQLHPCLSSASRFFDMTNLPSYADSNGFILIYPGTPNQSNCWDVHNPASLTHGQGGDALGIISMVNYALNRYSADRQRVFVMGFSSGGMMTNVMAGAYPDVFAAAASYSGVAFGCFQGKSPFPFRGSWAETGRPLLRGFDGDFCPLFRKY